MDDIEKRREALEALGYLFTDTGEGWTVKMPSEHKLDCGFFHSLREAVYMSERLAVDGKKWSRAPMPLDELIARLEANSHGPYGLVIFGEAAQALKTLRADREALVMNARANAIEEAALVVDNHRPDASFDDSGAGALERNALLDNVTAEIRALAGGKE